MRRLRERGITTPALFLTARTEVAQRVEGLDAGADDYLPKPFATPELLARLRAMLRRGDTYTPDLLTFHGVSLNRSTYELIYGGETRRLGGREFQVLEMMMQHPRAVMTTERLMTHIWGWDTDVDTSVVWVHVSNLRKKLSAIGAPVTIRFAGDRDRGVSDTLAVLIARDGRITIPQMVEATGLTRNRILSELDVMKAEGRLRRVGGPRGHWELRW